MDYIVSTLARGGFSKTDAAVYGLLLNEYVYVGKTGTSNDTGRSSPNRRLTFHVEKRGSTHSILWDDVFANSLVAPKDLAIRMLSIFVPTHLVAGRIERAAILTLQSRLEDKLLRNGPVRNLSHETTDEERQTADSFIDRLLEERKQWLRTNYATTSQPDPHARQNDGDQ
ncbi:MAG: hypothetical protein O3B13_25860 [Planctomycetota bacterium]|nr:hypothetical protein [Planctomycetota bacterium]